MYDDAFPDMYVLVLQLHGALDKYLPYTIWIWKSMDTELCGWPVNEEKF